MKKLTQVQWLVGVCRCGHLFAEHKHYRAGTECSRMYCGCPRYRLRRVRYLGRH